ncbi:transporter substrate-binding domain-containing protein [Micromonospora sp. WMMD882]|uniref:transporter substrate-binding domain-containing protein n=1 Tax=Micromonospora sp. WMMD882 TaxID=3015151 RepID=UPI00248CBF97|nr:transporter substrate-binding domain-containing protein [Micromonospora sp. WMMD882]WBB80531.1 transporter substrate-binding domain-containing protein [Micromonospora sp. WMMD882]
MSRPGAPAPGRRTATRGTVRRPLPVAVRRPLPVAVRAVLAATLTLVVAACAASTVPATAPAPLPAGVAEAPTGEPANDLCTVRRSFAPSEQRPARVGDRLVVGVDPSDATMSYWNAQEQTFQGFLIDLVLEVARALWPREDPRGRVTFKVVPPGQGPFALLAAGEIQMIATSLTASCGRARQVIFSNDYLDSGQTALVRKVDGRPQFRGMEQLGGRRVCAARETTSLKAIAGYRTAAGRALVPVSAPHPVDCLVMLRQGQVDAVSTDENILVGLAEIAPDTTLVTEPPPGNRKFCDYHTGRDAGTCTWFTDEPHAFALDNEELARFVNHVLESTRASGVWRRAHERWLRGHPDRGMPTPGQPPVTDWPPPSGPPD